jgi:hypothetical protein
MSRIPPFFRGQGAKNFFLSVTKSRPPNRGTGLVLASGRLELQKKKKARTKEKIGRSLTMVASAVGKVAAEIKPVPMPDSLLLCAVCAAKRDGRKPPKRKCTCISGAAQRRNHINRWDERERRIDADFLPWLRNKVCPWDSHGGLESSAFENFECKLKEAMGIDDLDAAQNLLQNRDAVSRFRRDHEQAMMELEHELFVTACEDGNQPAIDLWLDPENETCITVDGLYRHEDAIGAQAACPIAAPPLHIAASQGHSDVVEALLTRGADPHQLASDQTSAFWIAAVGNHVAVMQLLHQYGVDKHSMAVPDQDGTTAVLAATRHNCIEALLFMHECGVDFWQRGSIYLDYCFQWAGAPHYWYYLQYQTLSTDVTPLMVAQKLKSHTRKLIRCEPYSKPPLPLLEQDPTNTLMMGPPGPDCPIPLPAFLHSQPDIYSDLCDLIEDLVPQSTPKASHSLEVRAANAGVLERMKPIPETLRTAAQRGCKDSKKAIKRIQIANHQIVSRAESKQKV